MRNIIYQYFFRKRKNPINHRTTVMKHSNISQGKRNISCNPIPKPIDYSITGWQLRFPSKNIELQHSSLSLIYSFDFRL